MVIRVNGSATLIGRFILCTVDKVWAYSDHSIRIRIDRNRVEPSFLAMYANSPASRNYFENMFITTAGQKTINQTHLGNLLINLPTLEEQKRIVKKVDELMRLCDMLEKQQEQRNTVRHTLTQSSLNSLTTTQTPDDLKRYWQHTTENFTELFKTPKSVSDLRQAVLQLAVMGKLVPQDPKDGDAGELLEEIEKFRAQESDVARKQSGDARALG
ncbi:MAG: restriction endonuclease subunit S [Trueperaceae bacterium]